MNRDASRYVTGSFILEKCGKVKNIKNFSKTSHFTCVIMYMEDEKGGFDMDKVFTELFGKYATGVYQYIGEEFKSKIKNRDYTDKSKKRIVRHCLLAKFREAGPPLYDKPERHDEIFDEMFGGLAAEIYRYVGSYYIWEIREFPEKYRTAEKRRALLQRSVVDKLQVDNSPFYD